MVKEAMEAIKELSKYSYSFDGKKYTIEEIEQVEEKLGLKIADDYRAYLMHCPSIWWWGYEFHGLEELCKKTLFERDRRSDDECFSMPDNLYVIRALTDEADYMLQDETGAIYLVDMFFEPIKVYKSLADYIYKEAIPEAMIDCRDHIYEDNPVSEQLGYREQEKLMKEDEEWLKNTMGIKSLDLLCSKEFREYAEGKEVSVRECIENYIELKSVDYLRQLFPANKKYSHVPMSAYEDTRWFSKFIGGDFWKFISSKKFNNFINNSYESTRQAMKEYILLNGIEKTRALSGIKQPGWFKKLKLKFRRDDVSREITNRELMEYGYAPFNKSGAKLELHHLGHMINAPIAELTKENYRRIGPVNEEISDTEIDREGMARMKRQYWRHRAR